MCDVVYTLCLEQLEAEVRAAQQIAGALAAAGAEDVEIPSLTAKRDEFDAWLVSEPVLVDRDRAELLDAIGVGRG